VIASTGADVAAALSGAIGAMSGPLHGGAPARVIPMIEEAEKTGDARAVVKGILDRKEKLMGFGHRVYRAEDPRARVLRATAKRLEAPRYEVAAALEQAALAELRERRPERRVLGGGDPGLRSGADEDDACHVHLRPHCGLVCAHSGAEAARQAGPAGRDLRRPRSARSRIG
jgi:citrate synthase